MNAPPRQLATVLHAPIPASARNAPADHPDPLVRGADGLTRAPVPFSAACSTSLQRIFTLAGEGLTELALPGADTEVLPGIAWGRVDQFLTPAYWRARAWFAEQQGDMDVRFALGTTLVEEVAACLLGGHGIPAEVGLAAYDRLRSLNYFDGTPHEAGTLMDVLSEPLLVGGRRVRYRFARQRSEYLSGSLSRLVRELPSDLEDVALRDWLAALPGIGLKTASWVTRNHRASDEVAILDVHLHRAGVVAGFFLPRHSLARDYHEMEARFITFAWAIGVRPSVLDALMWMDMKVAGRVGRQLYHLRLNGGGSLRKPE